MRDDFNQKDWCVWFLDRCSWLQLYNLDEQKGWKGDPIPVILKSIGRFNVSTLFQLWWIRWSLDEMFEIGVRVQTYSQLGTVSDTKVEYRVYQVSRLGRSNDNWCCHFGIEPALTYFAADYLKGYFGERQQQQSNSATTSAVRTNRNCWWLKSQTTTRDAWNPANNGRGYRATYQQVEDFFHQQDIILPLFVFLFVRTRLKWGIDRWSQNICRRTNWKILEGCSKIF